MKRAIVFGMPVIAVNLAQSVYEKIKSFIEKGLYAGPEQFLEIAAFNQVALEQGLKPEEIVARGHREVSDLQAVGAHAGVIQAARPRPRRSKRGRVRIPVRHKAPRATQAVDLSTLLARLSITDDQVTLPATVRATAQPQPERLWGQVNRLFPLKFACRWLVVSNAGKSAWDRYEGISEGMSGDAATLGSQLENLDLAAGRKRDELLATGLPRRGNIASQDRFLSQFIARTTRSGEIYRGAICQYALAEFDGDRLALTDRGFELAKLKNPILDEDLRRAASNLSDEERTFLTRQVLQYVPGELHEIRLILGAVLGGQTTPEDLLASVRPPLPSEWSDVMIRTHVSGVIARLNEMGLLRRHWEGRNVNYEAAGMASTLLANGADGLL